MMSNLGRRITVSSVTNRRAETIQNIDHVLNQPKSSSLDRSEREIKVLKEENKKLRCECEDVRSLYNQLMKENSHECFEERRVMMLKAQVVQLERQVLLLSEALGSRSAVLTEVENALCWLADRFRTYITKDIRGADVNIQRSELKQMVETAESARIKLYRNIENNTTENCSRTVLLLSNFLKPSRQNDLSLLDVASGNLEFLNLKEVGKLESSLCGLYKDLIKLHSLLEENDGDSRPVAASCHMTVAYHDRRTNQLLKCCAVMRDCCHSLMELSLLHPSAPLPPLRKSPLKKVTCEQVMKSLPSFPRSKAAEAQRTIEALLKAFSFKTHMLTQQVKALKEELKFHQSVYATQITYVESLFQAVRQGYLEFEQSIEQVVKEPLNDILQAYRKLQTCASESELRVFLTNFKNNEEQLQEAVDKLTISSKEPSHGQIVISSFGEEFFKSIDILVEQCQKSRDRECLERVDLRAEQERQNAELQDILDEQAQRFAALKEPKQELQLNIQFKNIHIDDSMADDSSQNALHAKSAESSGKKATDSAEKDTYVSVHQTESCISSIKSNLSWDERGNLHSDQKLDNINLYKQPTISKSKAKKRINPEISTKPRGYIPNTTVPKRTLQLKKSGSLPKLMGDFSGPEVIKDETLKQSDISHIDDSETTIYK